MEKWTFTSRRMGASWLRAALLACLLPTASAADGTAPIPSPVVADIMKSIRAATFEVVMKKAESDPLKYEKPLPMELLPFAQRNDKYDSIGTAFAIAPGSFVTAAHVTSSASGSMLGTPALRDAQGNVYPIDKVTRFSMGKDFIVFTVVGAPRVTPLPTSTDIQVDTPVLAVGNALGEGIVARDGTLTSQTPEEQEGRWKWIRFSAPASPGNSGGPLLDAKGRVIGVIARKSPNENLNYALPISLLLDAPANKAEMGSRMTVSLPFMPTARKVLTINAGFDLPLAFSEFDAKVLALTNQNGQAALDQLMHDSADSIYPRGKSARVLADFFLTPNPQLVMQQPDGYWDVPRNTNGGGAQLGNDGQVWVNSQANTLLFRIHYPADLDVAKSRGDSRLLGEQLFKAITLSREIGSERIRITSPGDAGKPEMIHDDVGRVWQQWRYPFPYQDSVLVLAALPTPDGYVGMMRLGKNFAATNMAADLRLMMNLMQVPYDGTLPQWRAFLGDEKLRPAPMAQWKTALDPAGEVSIELPRLGLTVDKRVLNVSDRSHMRVIAGMMMDGEHAAWDVLNLSVILDDSPATTRIAALRRPRPASDAGQGAMANWADMVQLRGRYAGNPQRNGNSFFVQKLVGAAGTQPADARFFYELTYGAPMSASEAEVASAGPRLLEMFHVREK